jgi:hypothetical protein
MHKRIAQIRAASLVHSYDGESGIRQACLLTISERLRIERVAAEALGQRDSPTSCPSHFLQSTKGVSGRRIVRGSFPIPCGNQLLGLATKVWADPNVG